MNKITELLKKIGLAEIWYRLMESSPKLFAVLQWIIGIGISLCAAITALPENLLVKFPDWVMYFHGPDSIIMGVLMWAIARLPVKSTAALQAKLK